MELFKSFVYAVLGLATTGVVFYFGTLLLEWISKTYGPFMVFEVLFAGVLLVAFTGIIYQLRGNKFM